MISEAAERDGIGLLIGARRQLCFSTKKNPIVSAILPDVVNVCSVDPMHALNHTHTHSWSVRGEKKRI